MLQAPCEAGLILRHPCISWLGGRSQTTIDCASRLVYATGHCERRKDTIQSYRGQNSLLW